LDIIKQIDRLSVIGRQCVAVICLERYCKKYNINHPDIDLFINHVWKVTQVGPNNFSEWERGFAVMPITSQGDTYPEDLIKAIPIELFNEFDLLTQYVFETSATTWYGSDIEGTKRYLSKVIDIVSKKGIPIPELNNYINDPVEILGGWGPALNNEHLKAWRDTV
jgi:hypothetical protein